MRYDELLDQINTPVFHTHQIAKRFPHENSVALRFQLSRLAKRNKIIRLKRGLYLFKDRLVDELVLANSIYEPSYVSLEKALNIYGIIPDIPSEVTSITTTTSNLFVTPLGNFSYSCINTSLYFGYTQQLDHKSQLSYQIAEPEKALLDWIYIRKIKDINENRVDISQLNQGRLRQFAQIYPDWVSKSIK
jgi:predicted transcriptional regulator of viral defense system